MERDFNTKYDEANASITNTMKTVDGRLERMKESCQKQMNEIHDMQQGIIDENNNIWKDIETLKLEVTRLESRNDTLTNTAPTLKLEITKLDSRHLVLTTSTSNSITATTASHATPATTTTTDNNDTRPQTRKTTFMGSHPIDTTAQDRHPILTPFQFLFLYPIGNHHVVEVES